MAKEARQQALKAQRMKRQTEMQDMIPISSKARLQRSIKRTFDLAGYALSHFYSNNYYDE